VAPAAADGSVGVPAGGLERAHAACVAAVTPAPLPGALVHPHWHGCVGCHRLRPLPRVHQALLLVS
jgi:hypothetical protein